MNSVISAATREDRDFVNEGRHRANEGTGEAAAKRHSPGTQSLHVGSRLPGMAGGRGAQDVPQVSPNLYGEGLTPYLEQIHFKSQSWEGGTAYALNLPPPC